MVSFALGALVLYLIHLYKRRQIDRLWLIPPLMALWVNLHGGFAIGFILLLGTLAGEVIAHLKRRGLYDNSIVVFTADHGENLYDHGLDLGHGEHFRGEYATHVPMIVKFHDGYAPRVRVSRYDGVVQQIDFAPTLLDVMGLDGAAGPIDHARLNVDGGAISLGHPVGCSGNRIVLHLVNAMKRLGTRRGIATECIGGGLGGAMLVEAGE